MAQAVAGTYRRPVRLSDRYHSWHLARHERAAERRRVRQMLAERGNGQATGSRF